MAGGREDHWKDARKDLKKHLLVMEGLSAKVRELGQVRPPAPSCQPSQKAQATYVALLHLGQILVQSGWTANPGSSSVYLPSPNRRARAVCGQKIEGVPLQPGMSTEEYLVHDPLFHQQPEVNSLPRFSHQLISLED
jgi:hypothetical protein